MNILQSRAWLITATWLAFIACGLLFNSASAKTNFSGQYSTPNKVVAIGDIHGAYDRFNAILKELKLIDDSDNWIGGNTYLVSLGDLIDRGEGSRQVLDLMIKIQKQAPESGGLVLQVLGNHELMVTTGDLRYVSVEEYAAFKDDETAQQRTDLLAQYKFENPDMAEDELLTKFTKEYPPGYVALVNAFSPKGKYGRWLRTALPVIKVNDSLFAHGGLSTDLAGMELAEINKMVKPIWEYQDIVQSLQSKKVLPLTTNYWTRTEYLNNKLLPYAEKKKKNSNARMPSWAKHFVRLYQLEESAFSDRSPMWYRGNAYCHPYSESFNTEGLLKSLDAKRIVVGHTPLYKQVRSRLDGQVILADTGMLKKAYNGNATALVFANNTIQVHSLGATELSPLLTEVNRFSVGSKSLSEAEIKDLLLTADITHSEKIGVGITDSSIVTLEKNGNKIRALLKTFDSDRRFETKKSSKGKNYVADRYQHEIAAYRLDRMLGLNLVPVAVKRQVDNKTGLLQYWVENLRNEKDREEQNIEFNSYCPRLEQYISRYIFDVLIYNDDRNQTNLTFSKKGNMLYLIDHSIAFGLSKNPPKMYKKITLKLSSLFRKKLASLSQDNLQQQLGDVLHRTQIKAMIQRRDMILAKAKSP